MGDGEQTELAPTETDTESARAWGLAEDYPDDEPPTVRIAPSRITALAVAASLLVTAMAGVVVFRKLHDDDAVTVASPVEASTAPVAIVVPPVPPKPTLPLLNGTYRIFHDWPATTYRNNERKGGGTVQWDNSAMPAYKSFVFTTACTDTCIASGRPLDDQRRVVSGDPFVMQLIDGDWKDIAPMHWQQQCTYVDTGAVAGEATQSERTDFTPKPDGTFVGTQTVTVDSDGCGDKGNIAITPLVMTHIWG